MTKQYYIEIIQEEISGHITRSEVRKATTEEIEEAKSSYLAGKCKHKLVQDTTSHLFDVRSCALCGAGLGAI
jgi:hypothetical protein